MDSSQRSVSPPSTGMRRRRSEVSLAGSCRGGSSACARATAAKSSNRGRGSVIAATVRERVSATWLSAPGMWRMSETNWVT